MLQHLASRLLCMCKSVMANSFSSTQPQTHEQTWVAQDLWKEVWEVRLVITSRDGVPVRVFEPQGYRA